MPNKQQEREQILTVLQSFSPVFDPANPQPLITGAVVFLQAALPKASEKTIKQFLRWWTNRTAYHQAVIDGEWRHDLDGNRVTEIKDQHRQWARGRLVFIARQRAKANRKKKEAMVAS